MFGDVSKCKTQFKVSPDRDTSHNSVTKATSSVQESILIQEFP
jgi:hypothetical protein